MTFAVRRAAEVCAASIVLLGIGTPAGAAASDDGLWYFDALGVQDAHDAGITGEGITIAMIDSPVYLDVPTLQGADIRVQTPACVSSDGERYPSTSDDFDLASHGTHSLSLLVGSGIGLNGQAGVKGIAPDATVLAYATPIGSAYEDLQESICAGARTPWGAPMEPKNNVTAAIYDAIDQGADIITASIGSFAYDDMHLAIGRAVREGVIVVAGVRNPGTENLIAAEAPADLNGVLSVNMISPDGEVPLQENTDVVAPGSAILHQGNSAGDWTQQARVSGTSSATPIVAGSIALALQKHPDATPNQILQSVIHNTGVEPHPLDFDDTFGYGTVIASSLVDADPTQYPDVNPLVTNFVDIVPRVDWIWGGSVNDVNEAPGREGGVSRPYPVYTPQPGDVSAPEYIGALGPNIRGLLGPEPSAAPSPETPTEPTAPPSDDETSGLPVWVIPAVIAALVALAVIATIIIVVIRSSRTRGGQHGTQ